MIVEFSQNGHICREFEITSNINRALELIRRLNHKAFGRGQYYVRGYRHSEYHGGSSNWSISALNSCLSRRE